MTFKTCSVLACSNTNKNCDTSILKLSREMLSQLNLKPSVEIYMCLEHWPSDAIQSGKRKRFKASAVMPFTKEELLIEDDYSSDDDDDNEEASNEAADDLDPGDRLSQTSFPVRDEVTGAEEEGAEEELMGGTPIEVGSVGWWWWWLW